MNDVNCSGIENSLIDCPFAGWGQNDCSHDQDAGVICTNVRIVNGSMPLQGRVEVYKHGEWGTVCNDAWDDLEARVVCRQLGHEEGTAVDNPGSYYTRGVLDIGMDDLNCSGAEDALTDCPYGGWKKHNCGHHEDAGVICTN
ncbi:deleted in malignant brain tumors 1 protein-like [Pecten maximus]|uniref:deleted in malignant brain tumors 1 protein-like n=1 Tax=Pecten maximus TaxID=6579 RepID=UPI0014590030|nr:deleted in malignant brain tumors 1 protein-like [Pecten maximus]